VVLVVGWWGGGGGGGCISGLPSCLLLSDEGGAAPVLASG